MGRMGSNPTVSGTINAKLKYQWLDLSRVLCGKGLLRVWISTNDDDKDKFKGRDGDKDPESDSIIHI